MEILNIEQIIERLNEWKQDALFDISNISCSHKEIRIATLKHSLLLSAIANLKELNELNK